MINYFLLLLPERMIMGNLIIMAVLFGVIFFIFKIYQYFRQKNNVAQDLINNPSHDYAKKETVPDISTLAGMKFKTSNIIRITALIMVLVCLYKIYLCFGMFSYQSKLIYGSSVKGPVSLLILFHMIVCSCGIVIAIAIFFRKSWSYRPALVINYYLLLTTSVSLLFFIPKFSIELFNREAGYLISIILPLIASLWCIYYLSRSEVKANFNKDKILTTSAYKSKVVLGIILSVLVLAIISFLFSTFSTSEKSTANFAKSAIPPAYDHSKDLYKLGCSREVQKIVFSPDSQYAYTFANEDRNLTLWDVAAGKEIRKFEGLLGGLWTALFSPNGKFIASKIGDNLVIWDLQSEKEISRIELEESRIMRIATFLPDGRYIAMSLKNNIISVRDVFTKQEVKKLEGAKGWVDSISSSPDGKYIVASRGLRSERAIVKGEQPYEGSIVLWDYETGKKLWERDSNGKTMFVCFSPDGKSIAVRTYTSNVILLLDAANGNQLKSFSGHSGSVRSINFSPDGKYLLSGGTDATIRLWNVASGKEIKQLIGHSSSLITALFSPDGKNIISSSRDETIRLWSAASGKEIRRLERVCRAFYSAAFSPSGDHIISVSNDNFLRLWDVQSGKQIKSFQGNTDKVFTAMFSPDGKYIVSSAVNNGIILLDALSGKKIKTFSGHTDFISSAVFTPDSKNIVSGSNDKTIRIWDVSSGRELQKFAVQNTGIISVSVSPDGQYIVSCGFGNGESRTHMKLWSISTGKEILEYKGYSAETAASFSPDSKFVISRKSRVAAAFIITKEVYDRAFHGHTDRVNSVHCSPDGKKIVTGSSDRTVRLWDFTSAKEMSILTGHTASVTSVAFSPDGKQIISGSMDNTLRLWDVASGKELKQFEIKQN
jgi:WD40 repeat protein